LEVIPDAYAVVNPQVSPNYPFKGLAGVGVAFKVINAIMEEKKLNNEKRAELFNYYLPIVAIGTVTDIVPLVQENRAIVKRGLELINTNKNAIPPGLQGMIKHLNLDNIDTFHIGFMIGPRINAGGRIASPYKSLHTLLHQGDRQKQALEELEAINTKRRKMQEDMFKQAEKQIDIAQNILFAESEDFHEGIVGIISGRITEKYNKPSAIFKINKEENIATASLRAPNYFNIVDMLKAHDDILERFGGHKQAGGLTVKLENLNTLQEKLNTYCNTRINEEQLEKIIEIDTELLEKDINTDILQKIEKLAPFGEANPEPVFLLNDIAITKVDKVGQKGKGHLKIEGMKGGTPVQCIFWGKGEEVPQRKEKINNQETINIIGKIQQDSYRGGQYINGIHYFK
ncbi:MAG: hypothetical protein CR971_02705, partial [candidate division SR1 bacterium]